MIQILKTMKKIINRSLTYGIGIFYLTSLFTNAFTGTENIIGLKCLFLGGVSIMYGALIIFGAWSANVLFFLNFLIPKKGSIIKLILSGLCVLLALSALTINEIPVKSNAPFTAVTVGIGYYFWTVSFLMLFVKNLGEYKEEKIISLLSAQA